MFMLWCDSEQVGWEVVRMRKKSGQGAQGIDGIIIVTEVERA
jgi:hypothetical protein